MAATIDPTKPLIPATQTARRRGCDCPVVKNQFGDGCGWEAKPKEGQRIEHFEGRPYLVNLACEVHGEANQEPGTQNEQPLA